MKSLAIEREFGSGGREIGMRVADAAGIPCYDSSLLVEAAKRYGISIGKLQDYDEKGGGSMLYNLMRAANLCQEKETSEMYEIQYGVKETIRRLEAEGPAVFIGRCATEILKYRPDVVRVYVYSSNEQKKINRIVRTEGVKKDEAKWMMERKDRSRRNYFRFFTEKDWQDRGNYDLELNTDMISVEECADILLYMIRKTEN